MSWGRSTGASSPSTALSPSRPDDDRGRGEVLFTVSVFGSSFTTSIASEAVVTEDITAGVDTAPASFGASSEVTCTAGEVGDENELSDGSLVSLSSVIDGIAVDTTTSSAAVMIGIDVVGVGDGALLLSSNITVNGTTCSLPLFSDKSSTILLDPLSLSSALQLSDSSMNVSTIPCCPVTTDVVSCISSSVTLSSGCCCCCGRSLGLVG